MTNDEAPAISLSNLPAAPDQRRAVLIVAVLLVLGLAAVAAFAHTPMPRIDGFTPALQSIIIINDLITSVLLYAQYAIRPSRALLVLAASYLFTALIVVAHLLTFPGAFAPNGLLGAGTQSTAWLYYIWHLAIAAGVLTHASLKDAGSANEVKRDPRSALRLSVVIVIALAGALTWFVTQQDRFLPAIMGVDGIQASGILWQSLGGLIMLVGAVALGLLWARRRTVLDYWLMLVVFALIVELTCTSLFGNARFALGWYAGRLYSLITSVVVLVLLLQETTRLYARLARSNLLLEREREEVRNAKDAAEASLQNLLETQTSLIEAEKHAALGRLVAGVAHEVNSPVGTGLTVASSMERQCALFAEEVARGEMKRSSLNEFLEASQKGTALVVANLHRVAELVQSFRQVAADLNSSDRRIFDIGDLTKQILMTLRPGLRMRDLTVNVECQPDLLINSYPGPYGQVLTNLLHNSVTHAFPDRKRGTVCITVRAARLDDVEILFSDDGCGMSPDVKRQAFNPFFTTRRNQGNTGLGLHVVYNIVVNRLGGQINLHSSPGVGTKFQIILPRVTQAERQPGPGGRSPNRQARRPGGGAAIPRVL
jgi:signal transduction histidine kinase